MRLLFIYFYKDKGTFKKGTTIRLSKKYKINKTTASDDNSEFNFSLSKNPSFQEDFYSKNTDLGILIGENGTGKSVLLNSIRDANNDYSITIYKKDDRFYYTGDMYTKKIKLNDTNIIKENNQKFIYFSHAYENLSIGDLSNNISNQYFLSIYDTSSKPFKEKLSWIENDDIKRFFDFSNKYKIDGVSLPKVKLEYNPNFFNTIKVNKLLQHKSTIIEISHLYEKKLDFNHKEKLIKSFFSKINEELKNTINIPPILSNIDIELNSLIKIRNINFLTDYSSQICANINIDTKLIEHKAEEYLNQEQNIEDIQLLINYSNEIKSLNEFSIQEFNSLILGLKPFIIKIFDSDTEDNKINFLFFILKYIEGHPWFISLKDYDSNLFNKLIIYYLIENDKVNILDKIDYKLKLDIAKRCIIDGIICLVNILDKNIDLKGILYENIDYLYEVIQQNSVNKEIQKLIYILKYENFYRNQQDILKLQYYLFKKYNENLDINFYKNDKIPQSELEKNSFVIIQNKYFEKLQLDKDNNLEIDTVAFDDYNEFKDNRTFPFYYEMSPKPSSGERTRLVLFARLFNEIYRQKPHSNIILLLDELDLTLHLEWQRRIINELVKFLNTLPFKFYILYATHSPMILSDVTDDRVVFLKKENEFSKDVSENNEDKKRTFGANIYDLYHDSFFMNQFMGEFAQNKINEIIDIINLHKIVTKIDKTEKILKDFEKSYNLYKIFNSYYKRYNVKNIINEDSWEKEFIQIQANFKITEFTNTIEKDKAYLNKTIESIGEPILRNQLLDDIKNIGVINNIDEIFHQLKNLSPDEIEQELLKYDREKQIEIWKKLFQSKDIK